jgi:predicted metal-dependent phosphoesterase TrpH
MKRIAVDLHCHTHASRDAWTPPAVLVERAQEAGLDRIAVTDHGEIEGALRARELDPERIIVGEEIKCACGTELIGLFLERRIEPGLPIEEVAERIRDQGGVVYVPHPFAYPWRVQERARRALVLADLVEGFNARAFWPQWNRAAVSAASARGLPCFAGSDAHFPREIGRAYTWLPEFSGPAELLRVARQATLARTHSSHATVHVASVSLRLLRAVTNRPRTALDSSMQPYGTPAPVPTPAPTDES